MGAAKHWLQEAEGGKGRCARVGAQGGGMEAGLAGRDVGVVARVRAATPSPCYAPLPWAQMPWVEGPNFLFLPKI